MIWKPRLTMLCGCYFSWFIIRTEDPYAALDGKWYNSRAAAEYRLDTVMKKYGFNEENSERINDMTNDMTIQEAEQQARTRSGGLCEGEIVSEKRRCPNHQGKPAITFKGGVVLSINLRHRNGDNEPDQMLVLCQKCSIEHDKIKKRAYQPRPKKVDPKQVSMFD